MSFFKYLASILQYSSLNGHFHENSKKKNSKCILIDLKARIHYEIFLSDYFMKHKFNIYFITFNLVS